MQTIYYELILAGVAAVLSWSLIGLYTRAMTASRRLEAPNERSMHNVPVPVGAGLAIVATALFLWPLWHGGTLSNLQLLLLASFAALAALSWLDDRRSLSPAVRLALQAMAVALCLAFVAPDARAAPFLPLAVERVLLGIAWLWFINLFNFMDGIDGLAGAETVAVALGYAAVLSLAGLDDPLWRLALIIAAAAVGYLAWNWHPAKVFMGDAGSVPLGFLLGWLMIDLSLKGYWPAAVILPLYFVADATLTLGWRMLRQEMPWKAHREHFYQRAVLGGTGPSNVVARIIVADVALVAAALISVNRPILAVLAAVGTVASLLLHLDGLGRRRPSPSGTAKQR